MNTDKKLTFKQLTNDFLGDYFTFDSKFFRSLIPLIIKPGHLTREYLNGKRVSYILPLRLYIFTTFVFFFLVSFNTKMDYNKFSNNPKDSTIVNESIVDSTDLLTKRIDKGLNTEISYSIDSTKNKKEVVVEGPGFKFSIGKDKENNNALVRYFNNKSKYLASFGKESSAIFWKEFVNQIPKVMFILLPLFALFLKLLYVRKKILYIEHLVFSLHIHTFIFIVLIISVFIPNTYIIFGLFLLILIYLFFSLINFYQQSILKSSLKFLLLIILYLFSLLPTFLILTFLAMASI
ncbi:MAG: DUF3667 domain-containing protein [Ignavibacteriae bacterium]|nr:DUF3667 domain-containing protein [Ignavibacteriota bacterium]